MSDYWEHADFDTGPFCRHWSDPSDCDEMCVCGHECHNHSNYEEGMCTLCECEEFRDEEE